MEDIEYASDVVGDGSSNIVGPFEAAQSQFIGGQVVPLVVGAFGDVNTNLEKMLKTLAKLAAAGEEGMSISLLRNLDKKGGAFVIMNHQFRRALGVSIVRIWQIISYLDYIMFELLQKMLSILRRLIIAIREDGIMVVEEEVDGTLSILQEDMLILNSSVMGTSLVLFKSVLTVTC